MPELFIRDLRMDDAAAEDASATRERLRGGFPAGAARRMTQQGLLVGSVLGPLGPAEDDAIVYASRFGESRALEAYLDSFPAASPTLFQTSIHPSGVQQLLIGRQVGCRQLFSLSGDRYLPLQALLTASLTGAARTLLCGGEERGGWLVDHGMAASESFAFALALGADRSADSIGRIVLERCPGTGALTLREWFVLLLSRSPFDGPAGPGWRLRLEWF